MKWRWKLGFDIRSWRSEWSREGILRKFNEEVERGYQQRQRLRVRFARFVHSRLWLGLPLVAIVAFVLFFLLATLENPVSEALSRGGLAAVLMALCWGIGIWGSTDLDREMTEEADEAAGWVERLKQSGVVGRMAARGVAILLLVLLVGLLCYPQIEGLVTGSDSPVEGLVGILLKLLAAVVVLLPIHLAQRHG